MDKKKGRKGFAMERTKKPKPLFNTTRLITGGFAAVILAGTLILMLPISSAGGQWTGFLDAMFTATTSVCVTGLVVVPTYSYWSLFGKIVILILIQLGGLGVICIAMELFIIFRKKITLKERRLIQESYNLDNYNGMVKVILNVFRITFAVEIIGAILYSIRFIPEFGLIRGIGYSVFHAISAFCNAGLDLLGNASLAPYYDDVLINMITIFLIVSGGLGFIVWWELLNIFQQVRKKKITWNKIIERLSLHSKLAIAVTGILIISGAVFIFLFECNNPATIGNMPIGKKVLVSLFESVTLRTAGFSTISQTGFRDITFFVLCFMMIIGGSPVGTAGGIKTTTVAIIVVEVLSVVQGKKHAEVFRRRINNENVRTAISVASISLLSVILGIMILSVTEQGSMKKIVFEAFSAIGTVGLSMDFTASLTIYGKIIIIVMMYLGRIGPITMAMAFITRRRKALDRDLPEKRIIIG